MVEREYLTISLVRTCATPTAVPRAAHMRDGRKVPKVYGLPRAVALLALLLLSVVAAQASVAVLLEEPYGDLGAVDPAGHVAIYLDHVCAVTPVSLRPCQPGELGVVISRYDGIGHIDWMAMPLIPYLYAVDSAEDIPVSVNAADVRRLRDAYRRAHLEAFAPDLPDGSAPSGNWYELAGATFDRSIYGFQVNSTPEQDAQLIASFNDHKNQDDYNGAFRNCADFARVTINSFYPHAIRRNYIADFGLTSPKSVARGLTHYAHKHPAVGLQAFVIMQLSGDAPRSHAPQGLAEGILKHFGVPLLVVSPPTTAIIAAAYVSHGRFAEPKDAPVLNLRPGLVMEGAVNWTPATAPALPVDGIAAAALKMPAGMPAAHLSTAVAPVQAVRPVQAAPAASTIITTSFVNGTPE